MSCDGCVQNFRFEFCDLRTGRVKAVYPVLSADWQETLVQMGQGTINVATKDVSLLNVWPHLTSVYVLRTTGGTATTRDPVVEGALVVEKMTASSGGATSLGMKSIEEYLLHRMIRERLNFGRYRTTSDQPQDQNQIAKALVDYCIPNGIPLRAQAFKSVWHRDRTYDPNERKMVGEALLDLAGVIGGPEWEMTHEKVNGGWVSTMNFKDQIGADQGIRLRSDHEAIDYGMDVDAQNHATFVDAIGAASSDAEGAPPLIAHAEDESDIYPQYDAAPAWTDVKQLETLQEHADGYLETNQDPFAVPDVVIKGLDIDPTNLRLGDTVNVDLEYGAIVYKGPARINSISWAVGADEPVSRTLDLVPLVRASESMLYQVAEDECKNC